METFWSKLQRKSLQAMSLDRMISKAEGSIQLKRCLGLLDLVMMGIGGIVGSGVFVLSGEVAKEYTGPSVILSYALSALAALFSALCYAEFSADVPISGAAYNYVALVYGELIAWLAASGLLLEYIISTSAVAKGFSGYLCTLFDKDSDSLIMKVSGTDDYIVIDVAGALMVIFLTILLCYGISESFTFNTIATSISLILIVFIILASTFKLDSNNWSPFFPDQFGFSHTVRGASIIFFAYIGFDSIATVAEEVRNPARDVPLSIIISVLTVASLYVLMAVALTGLVPYNKIDVFAPFSSAFEHVGWKWASRLVSIGALLGILTSCFSCFYSTCRILMVFGRDGFIPKFLATIHKKAATPINATVLAGAITATLTLLLDIETLSSLVSAGTLFTFNLVCQGVIWRRYRGMAHREPNDTTERASLVPMVIRMTLLIIVSILEGVSIDKEWPYWAWLITIVCFLAITASFLPLPIVFVSQKFSLPLQPLIPCLGVMSSMHLIVTLETAAFVRFVVWQGAAIIVYLVYGVHHTADLEEVNKEDGTDEPFINTVQSYKQTIHNSKSNDFSNQVSD